MRFRVRMAQQTLADEVEAHLTSLGWIGLTPPWGTSSVVISDAEPDSIERIEVNTVSMTIEDISPYGDAELGSLRVQEVDFYADVFGEKPSIAVSIAEDILVFLTDRITYIKDYTQNPAVVTTDQVEIEDVDMIRPSGSMTATDLKRNWRTVRATLKLYFAG